MQARVRPCTPDDARALALVGAASFLETYAHALSAADILDHCEAKHSAAHYAEWLAEPQWRLWLAEAAAGGAPVGYLALGPAVSPVAHPSGRDIEIHRIYVLAPFHRGGLGKCLMTAAFEAGRAAGKTRALLGVNKQNRAALAFYARVGFSVVGARKFQVGAIAHDDFVLARTISP